SSLASPWTLAGRWRGIATGNACSMPTAGGGSGRAPRWAANDLLDYAAAPQRKVLGPAEQQQPSPFARAQLNAHAVMALDFVQRHIQPVIHCEHVFGPAHDAASPRAGEQAFGLLSIGAHSGWPRVQAVDRVKADLVEQGAVELRVMRALRLVKRLDLAGL